MLEESFNICYHFVDINNNCKTAQTLEQSEIHSQAIENRLKKYIGTYFLL